MNHKKRVERFILVDILAGAGGTCVAAAFLQKSIPAAGLGVLIFVALWLLERATIEEEDQPAVATKEPGMQLSELVVAGLKKIASRPRLDYVAPENTEIYNAGLGDGAADLAQYVVEQVQPEKESV